MKITIDNGANVWYFELTDGHGEWSTGRIIEIIRLIYDLEVVDQKLLEVHGRGGDA